MYNFENFLSGKKIVITGAGSGIGRETALIASKAGAKLILVDVSEAGLSETTGIIQDKSTSVKVVDLSDFNHLPSIVKEVNDSIGPIDGIVHCAGISSRKPLNMLRPDSFEKILAVNFYSFQELVRLFSKRNNMNEGASIVVMSSVSSFKGYKAKSEYCVSKAAIDAFVRCMALELAPKKIRINSIQAAEVLTPLALKSRETAAIAGSSIDEAPLGPSSPEEVANLIIFLLSDATKTMTGSNILIDGGLTL